MTSYALGIGIGTKNTKGEWLEAVYPTPILQPSSSLSDFVLANTDETGTFTLSGEQLISSLTEIDATLAQSLTELKNAPQELLAGVVLQGDQAPSSVLEGYLKLQLISSRLVQPHGTDLSGLFGILPNLAWTNEGPIDLEELTDRQLQARAKGEWLTVQAVDKFPRMADYIVPSGVRIGDASRIRLGAHLGKGTTVMHEGFVNFNAGTLGTSMIEGRISAGVTVGDGSDLGGGCSTMGTLSGGGNITITIGENSLIGANAGTGIPLGDRCTIESGLYLTASAKVAIKDKEGKIVEHVKARDLAGQDDLLIIRNSMTGEIECRTNKSAVQLNSILHSNN